ncbi:hypothetical protein DYB32_009877 [Aphanomyces invadans]|uniref:Uncharacterized protein n=1 Tax=Aphanomyces invadans TaxID=157072 RepID=A0A3R6V3J8_9STRA|nr:hypothetical protein DYB32_009877 [Aphanomyces invadans]
MPRVTNCVDDIEGTKPCMKPYLYFHKPPTASVDGSTSKRLHPDTWNKGMNPQFMQLPIAGSSPSHTGFTTDRVDPIFPAYTDLDGDALETGLPIPKNIQFPDVAPRVSQRKSNNVSTIQLGMKVSKDRQKPPPTAPGAKQVAARQADIDAVRGLK